MFRGYVLWSAAVTASFVLGLLLPHFFVPHLIYQMLNLPRVQKLEELELPDPAAFVDAFESQTEKLGSHKMAPEPMAGEGSHAAGAASVPATLQME